MIVRFVRMGATGDAVAMVGRREVAVPYAAPGEEALVRILGVDGGRARGQLVALRVASPRVVQPRCPHFGRCGGCQWQHLEYAAQLEQKAALVAAALGRARLTPAIDAAVGWEPSWEFRTYLEAAVAERDGRRILGFFSRGGDRVVEVGQCPVQHPSNVDAMRAVRAAWDGLQGVVGILRGLISRVGAAKGEVILGLSVTRRLSAEERGIVVRALLDTVPRLIGVMEVRAPRRGHLLAGRQADLLWGRPYVEEDIAGVRFRIPLLAEFPVNRHAIAGLIEMILGALDASAADTVVEPEAGIGGYTLHVALGAGRVVAVTTVDQLNAAWENARLNGMTNCVFYARSPIRAVEKVARREPVRLAFLHPPGSGLVPGLPAALRRAGVQRVAYLGRALAALTRDAAALEQAGFRIREVQPMDLSPHTSRVHALITASV
jgi:23S rRNA (uracil1939-C5)-methyltransferase